MKTVKYLVFRYLTHADFFNIYKPLGTETTGGGQSYIDFETSFITKSNWQLFFAGIPSKSRANGPSWTFKVSSIGLNSSQNLTIYQRRTQSFSVSSQKIGTLQSNRVEAWHPDHGFPEPEDPTDRQSCPNGLAVYIVKTVEGEFWAGWFLKNSPCRDSKATNLLKKMLSNSPERGYAGFETISGPLYLDETDIGSPFYTLPTVPKKPSSIIIMPPPEGEDSHEPNSKDNKEPDKKASRIRSEEEITKSLFDEDEESSNVPAERKEILVKVITRNSRAVKDLKDLYKGRCQISGNRDTFLKKDGKPYCEAHHLVSLGKQGADSPFNVVIVSPLIHRMLHYADVSEIDLSKISTSNKLQISINGNSYQITWHPEHAKYVEKHKS